LPADCSVGSDAFLQGVAGVNSPSPTHSKEDCATACMQCVECCPRRNEEGSFSNNRIKCSFWKYGTNGGWCQLFATDGRPGNGWPIPGARNATGSVVFSGTLPGNGC
jgi:hypothetical protein